jgi:excisionase family DNA binding protein
MSAKPLFEEKPLTWSPIEAAEQLGVGVRRVYDLCASGEIGAVRIGTRWRIPNQAMYRYGVENGLIRDRFTDIEARVLKLERQVMAAHRGLVIMAAMATETDRQVLEGV